MLIEWLKRVFLFFYFFFLCECVFLYTATWQNDLTKKKQLVITIYLYLRNSNMLPLAAMHICPKDNFFFCSSFVTSQYRKSRKNGVLNVLFFTFGKVSFRTKSINTDLQFATSLLSLFLSVFEIGICKHRAFRPGGGVCG